jgi:hypothetical protein
MLAWSLPFYVWHIKKDVPTLFLQTEESAMATFISEFLKLRSFTTATQELNNWISGTEAFTLLVSAIDSGLLDTLRLPCTIQQITATTRLDEGRISNVLNALENHGLVQGHGDVFTLTSNIKNMMKGDAIQSLVPFIQAAKTRLRTLQDISALSKDYTELGADETLSMAQGIGIASVSPVRQSIGALTGQTMPELKKRWQSGARHLELGANSSFQNVPGQKSCMRCSRL